MAYGFGSRLVASCERKFGHLAFPGILHWIAGFQFLVFVLSAIDPNYMSLIAFDRDAIFSGQVWRLFSYLFFPQTNSMFWILISVFFMWFISNGLEAAWGSFRVNFYLLATMFCLTSLALIFPAFAGNGALLSTLVFSNLFIAFACLHPDQQIMLMMVIPIKVKYLAWMNAATLLVIFLSSPLLNALIIPALLPFLLVFGPDFLRDMRDRGKAANRRATFQSKINGPEKEAFHTCHKCEVDDITAPEIEFRVSSDGNEYCVPCLEKTQQENSLESQSD